MCERFRESFEAFLEDLGRRPGSNAFLNRIRPEYGYDCGRCPDCARRGATANCRWATRPDKRRKRWPEPVSPARPDTLPLPGWIAPVPLAV
jgi:hypothetical protein